MKEFSFLCVTKVIYNKQLRPALQQCKEELGSKKAFIVSGPFISTLPMYREFVEDVKATGMEVAKYNQIRNNPTDVSITACKQALEQAGCDVVIGFGGGSVLDTAKAAAVLMTNEGDISLYYGPGKIKKPSMPVIAIPTTAGSGAEVSDFVALTEAAAHKKAQMASHFCCPAYAILSPVVLKGAPKRSAAAAGYDALGHAIESYITKKANPITEPLALQAFGLVARNLCQFVEHTDDEEAAANMLLGSCLSVMSAGRVGNCDGHVLARTMQGTFDLSHGNAVAMALPYAMSCHVESASEKLSKCAREMGLDTAGMTDVEAAKACVLALQELREKLGMERSPKDFGVTMTQEQLDAMATNAVFFSENGSEKGSSPRKISYEEYKDMFQKIYDAVPVTFA